MTENLENNTTQETVENTNETSTSAENAQVESQEINFLDQITDEELKSSKSLSNFKDINGLAKSYVNLEKKLGQPKEPEKYSPEDYKYELPENYKANDDILNPIKEKAIELGVKPEAFKELLNTFTGKEQELISKMQAESEAKLNEATENLKKEWGNSYEENLKTAENTFQRFASEEDQESFSKMNPQDQMTIAKIMHNISQKIGESSQGKLGNSNNLTKEEAQNKINTIMNDANHPYHRGDNNAVSEFFDLHRFATSESS